MSLEKIYEDENVLVLNKPAGLVVHDDGKERKDKEKTLCDLVLEEYPEMENVGEPLDTGKDFIKRPGIVHRLDKETTGVIILAKNQDTFYFLKEQFQDRKTIKVYNTVVWGNIKNDKGIVDAPIGRNGKDFRQWSATRGARGQMREAVTEYKVLSRFEEDGEKFVFLEVRPKTGRTHQIRVHMKYLNNPIVGDTLYAENRPYVLGFERVALHARSLTIEIPEKGTKTFEAPFPDDFMELMTKI
ncbi:MAG: rRNA synthase [Patescibacteria group bacterium]|nr:rRNA synthase [Patescibacteria group bacterium]